ncbi:MAG: hypothetical protein ACRC8Y_11750 [Chroococcales cyanobacterium]
MVLIVTIFSNFVRAIAAFPSIPQLNPPFVVTTSVVPSGVRSNDFSRSLRCS